ncbi:MAG TPA: helix-hairpin-helix domain-containing protein [Gammaproteobacteria bacterium]|jgi:putative hydrolase|nr:helix-hairpin-helix domain-containing protein [Gammaproteobacteria bacterium]
MTKGATTPADRSFNVAAARLLRDCGELLRQQNANPFRVNAYRRAAQTLEALDVDARDILREQGLAGLVALPAIGSGLAAAIDEIRRTGRLSRLDRLRGAADPEALLRTVPGIGPELARRIHDELHVATLEALEIAAHDGRLATLSGLGPRRIAAIRAALLSMLGRAPGRFDRDRVHEPDVDVLLDVDREYRNRASKGTLPLLAPRRFNPERVAWLPILHTSRDGWHFTALYSNTALAHELQRTRDWVVVYFHGDDHQEGQRTIVTETQGQLRGKRVVRGREAQCAASYSSRAEAGLEAPV